MEYFQGPKFAKVSVGTSMSVPRPRTIRMSRGHFDSAARLFGNQADALVEQQNAYGAATQKMMAGWKGKSAEPMGSAIKEITDQMNETITHLNELKAQLKYARNSLTNADRTNAQQILQNMK